MNAITIPRPLSADDSTVTLDRAAWDTLVGQLEDAADLAAVAGNDARRAAVGTEAFMRECVTGDEALRHLEGEALVTIYRKRIGLTQRALAAKAGVGTSYLNEIEAGKKPGSVDALRKLAGALGVSMEALAG